MLVMAIIERSMWLSYTIGGSWYIIFQESYITSGNSLRPMIQPAIPPVTEAINAYAMYLNAITFLLYPSALYVPISPLSSATILVIVVRQTRAATTIKNIGNTVAMAFILSALDS